MLLRVVSSIVIRLTLRDNTRRIRHLISKADGMSRSNAVSDST